MRKTFLSIFLFLTLGTISSQNSGKTFRLIPQPQSIQLLDGKGITGNELNYVVAENETVIPVLGNILSLLPQTKKEGKGVLLKLTNQETVLSPEGYLLEINAKGVVVTAKTKAGLFYGCQTLEQLLEDSRDFKKEIPAMKITDYSALSYRSVHFDTKHHLDNMDYYYRAIDKLAHYKINGVIWELEDKLRFTRRPEIGAANAISKQEMQALCRYAKERNIDISPLVQGIGHAGFILKHHPELRENPQSDWEFCPSEPKTYELQFDLYRDALEAMPYSKYLHVGGDEVTAIGTDERCKATGKNAFQLQMVWLNKVCDFAVKNGRTPVFWDDMPLKYGGVMELVEKNITGDALSKKWNTQQLDAAIDLFPKECVYMRWNYDDPNGEAHKRILKWYEEKGLKVMAATAASAGDSPFLPRNNTRSQFVKDFSQLVADNHLVGILATAWDDGSPHLETVWRGYIAQGEFGWNPSARSVEEFKKTHAQREFGFQASENRLAFLDDLEETAFFFDRALVTEGRRNPAWGVKGFTLIDLPDKQNPGAWSKKYKNKIDTATLEAKRYEKISKEICIAKQNALRNRYTLDVYEQTNHLLNYPTRLILALYAYDSAQDDTSRKTASDKISEVCDYFGVMRSNLEKVYSQTRFMENAEGYIADQNNHHHLAALTNNSDWMYLYELPMIEKVRKWLGRY